MVKGRLGWWFLLQLGLLGSMACTGTRPPDPPAPAILRFQASSSLVDLGTSVRLQAGFVHGDGIITPEGGLVKTGGEVTVTPMRTTTYTLTVTAPGGQVSRQETTVTVRPGLAITIQGHEGSAGTVMVEGPQGYVRTLNASGTLTGLTAGEYTLTAAPAAVGPTTLHPWQPVQRVQVTTGTTVHVTYPAPTLALALPGGVAMEFLLVPAGTFTMGDEHPSNPRHLPSSSHAHLVTLTRAFYLAKTPTTQAQWEAILGSNPSAEKDPRYAVTNVSYLDLKNTFLPAANRQLPRSGLRLPTEAEWEYACRAGTTTTYFFGDDPAQIFDYAWSHEAFRSQAHSVGRKLPNPWGFHDLAGLVFQWCEDLAHDDYQSAPRDGSALSELPVGKDPVEGILRGYGPVGLNRQGGTSDGGSAIRWSWPLTARRWDLGFRLVAEPAFTQSLP